jgi:tetratricopeptide (TPR) repeat protein
LVEVEIKIKIETEVNLVWFKSLAFLVIIAFFTFVNPMPETSFSFEKLINEEPATVRKLSMQVLENYTFLSKAEQEEFEERFYKKALEYATVNPILFCYAKLLHAYNLFYREHYDAVLPLLTSTHDLFVELDDQPGASLCLLLQGNIYRTFGNVDMALKSLLAAHMQLKTDPLFVHFLMACHVNLGGIYFETNNSGEAIPHFKTALEKGEETGKFYWIIYSLHGLGKIYLAQKNYPEAKLFLDRAMKVADENYHPLSTCNSLSEMGNYHFATEDYKKAEAYHIQALNLREQNHFIGGAITSCIRLGEIYAHQHEFKKAIPILEKGLALAEEIHVKLKSYQIHFLLSRIYEQKNLLKKSLFHYKQYHILHGEVAIEDNARKIKNIQLVFEAEQTKKENVIIKRQKREIELKNFELRETIDELTRTKIGKKARAITLIIAVILFIFQDFILGFVLTVLPSKNYFISLIVKMAIIFSLSPINKGIETYLLKRLVKKKIHHPPSLEE